MTDYEKWKQWLDSWGVKYEEVQWNPGVKELIIDGIYSQASVMFNLDDTFKDLTSYE